MPLPIAHSLISTSVYAAYRGGLSVKRDAPWVALFVFVGLVPDLDMLLVPFAGMGFHRGVSHSILFALFSATTIFLIVRSMKGAAPRLWFFLFITAVLHPVCDFFTPDYLETRRGVQLLYPFSKLFYESPVPIFMGVELRYFHTIFSLHTVLVLFYEFVLTSTVLIATLYLKRARPGPVVQGTDGVE